VTNNGYAGQGVCESEINDNTNNAPPQNNLNLNRKRTSATKVKTAAISPATTQKPFGLPLNGMPPTFMPQMLAIKVAGRKITENIVSM
jgi:hypothetical protein